MSFTEHLYETCQKKDSLLCVGLDVVKERLPLCLAESEDPLVEFNKAIINATVDYVAAYKLNTAFYEAYGTLGWQALQTSIKLVPEGTIVIVDAKRGDVGHTSSMYAHALFKELDADAITASPFLGRDSVTPFLSDPTKGVFFLCLTSNPGSADFQRFASGSCMLFEHVAATVADWNELNNCGLIVGATHPGEMAKIRQLAPQLPFLIPGIGAQGGDIAQSVMYGTDEKGELALFNSSRGIIYKSNDPNYADMARREAKLLRDVINRARRNKNT
jgi:orotidine-5'-phosphate decarboxylase